MLAHENGCPFIRKPPPLILFQGQQDIVASFCTYSAYAPIALYWSAWALDLNGCARGGIPPFRAEDIPEPALDTLCTSPGIETANRTALMRAYVSPPGSCRSPMALFWTSETRGPRVANAHLWPGPISAFGGDSCGGACAAARFFGNIRRRRGVDVTTEEAFAGLLDPMGRCTDGSRSYGATGPCKGAPRVLPPAKAFMQAIGL